MRKRADRLGLNGAFVKNIRIWLLKRRLRAAYMSYRDALDDSRAGRHMSEQLPSVVARKQRVNRLLAKLAALDPKCRDMSIA